MQKPRPWIYLGSHWLVLWGLKNAFPRLNSLFWRIHYRWCFHSVAVCTTRRRNHCHLSIWLGIWQVCKYDRHGYSHCNLAWNPYRYVLVISRSFLEYNKIAANAVASVVQMKRPTMIVLPTFWRDSQRTAPSPCSLFGYVPITLNRVCTTLMWSLPGLGWYGFALWESWYRWRWRWRWR